MKKQCWQCGKLISNIGDRNSSRYELCQKCKAKLDAPKGDKA